MGCSSSRNSLITEVETRSILPFEALLGFNNLSSTDFDNMIHRYTSNGHMSLIQFTRAFDNLKLPYKEFKEFYEFFNMRKDNNQFEKSYNTQQLICLGIFLTKANLETKIQVLFQNYDLHAIKVLPREIIREMIENLVFVALVIIPYCIINKNKTNLDIVEYNSRISLYRNSLVLWMLNLIMSNSEKINFNDFKVKCTEKIPKKLFSSFKLRKYAFNKGSHFNISEEEGDNNYSKTSKKIVDPGNETKESSSPGGETERSNNMKNRISSKISIRHISDHEKPINNNKKKKYKKIIKHSETTLMPLIPPSVGNTLSVRSSDTKSISPMKSNRDASSEKRPDYH